jgi:hypothetical protein
MKNLTLAGLLLLIVSSALAQTMTFPPVDVKFDPAMDSHQSTLDKEESKFDQVIKGIGLVAFSEALPPPLGEILGVFLDVFSGFQEDLDKIISAAIEKQELVDIKASTLVIKDRLHRILSLNSSTSVKRPECVTAVSECEKVLYIFNDPNSVLHSNALQSTPVLLSFSHIFSMVAKATVLVDPTYRSELKQKMSLLSSTMATYQDEAIKGRMSYVKGGLWGSRTCWYIEDDFVKPTYLRLVGWPNIPGDFNNHVSSAYASYLSKFRNKIPNLDCVCKGSDKLSSLSAQCSFCKGKMLSLQFE